MNKRIMIWVIVLAVLATGGYFFLNKKPVSFPESEGTPEAANNFTSCGSDTECLSREFIKCSPAEFVVPFDVGNFTIAVLGLENGKCRYKTAIYDSSGGLLGPSLDCNTPFEMISEDTVGHFFGVDKEMGKETIKAVQDKIEKDYCVTLNP
ncbi:MAG: hypothetical protein WC507_02775 [Candidatus Paceibacterota bacterium]